MRLLLVVNAFASSVTPRNRVLVEQVLGEVGDLTVRETNRRGHATRFAQDAASRGVDVVVAFGGDGTLNEVANGLAGTDAALGVLPGGSTNVFARTIGEPNDPVAAVAVVAAAIERRAVRRVGLGLVNGRYFTFHTGIGFDAAVVAEVERRASAKRWLGHPLFVYAATKTWATGYDRRVPHFMVRSPGADPADGFFTVVLNTDPYTFLGNRPLRLSPTAGLEDPLVAVTFRRLGAASLLGSVGRALLGRRGIRPTRALDVRTGLTELVVESERPFPYQLDGDHLGDTRRLSFRWCPEALALVLPPPADGPAATESAPNR